MKLVLFQCRAGSPFRLGQVSLDTTDDIIHADTLCSALLNVHSLCFGREASDQLVMAIAKGQIRFSSAFHCIEQAENYIYYLPKPSSFSPPGIDDPKTRKRIRYISLGAWSAAENGGILGGTHFTTHQELTLLGLEKHENLADFPLVKEALIPHVRVHHDGQDEGYYNSLRLEMQAWTSRGRYWQVHYYCLLDDRAESSISKKLHTALHMLADEGVGGDRSVGCGLFESVSVHEASGFPLPQEHSKHLVSLSPTRPADAHEFAAFSSYRFQTRGGGTVGRSSNEIEHRKQVRMIAEGASLSRPVLGSFADVSPAPQSEDSVRMLRYGINLSIPYKP